MSNHSDLPNLKPKYFHISGCQICETDDGNMYEIPVLSVSRGSLYCCEECLPIAKAVRDKINASNSIASQEELEALRNTTFNIRRSNGDIENGWTFSNCLHIIWINDMKYIECIKDELTRVCNVNEILELNTVEVASPVSTIHNLKPVYFYYAECPGCNKYCGDMFEIPIENGAMYSCEKCLPLSA